MTASNVCNYTSLTKVNLLKLHKMHISKSKIYYFSVNLRLYFVSSDPVIKQNKQMS